MARGVLKSIYNKAAYGALCLLNVFSLSSCVLMRSSDDIGRGLPGTPEEVVKKGDQLREGMTLLEAFNVLGTTEDQVQRMTAEEISKELYAGVQLQASFDKRDEVEDFFRSMSGFWVRRLAIDRDSSYGFTASETHTTGRSVQFSVIFQDGILYKRGSDTGGPIDETRREGYLNGAGASIVIDSAKGAVVPR